MTALQKKILELLTVFDRFCRENGIPYFMLGGTMLGAYRHKGFIPWDDDADIGIPEKDFERFVILASRTDGSGLPEDYAVRYRTLEKEIPYAFAHMEDKRTTYIEHRRSHDSYAGGVYLEIFPLTGCSDYKWMQKVQEVKIVIDKRFLYGKIMDYAQKHRTFLKAVLIKYIRKHYTVDELTERLTKTVFRYPAENSRYLSNHLGHWGRRENIPKEWMFPQREYEFEGHLFFGAGEPEKYLASLYGDNFMKLPSKEEQERAKHPAFVMDLELPYELYEKRKN
jgi:lipopolysaccharide cholinephosphotransferase